MKYIINRKTQAIMEIDKGNLRTKIVEESRILYSSKKPLAIIQESSTQNGSSIEGRMQTVKRILKTNSKLPTPISPYAGIYFFPTSSARNKECVWFSYYQIKDVFKLSDRIAVKLKGGKVIFVNISMKQFDLQIKKTSQVIAYFHWLLYVDRLTY